MLWDRCPVCLSVTLVYCGQTAGWIKMTLGREVGLGPDDTVLQWLIELRFYVALDIKCHFGNVLPMGTQLPDGKGHSTPSPTLFGPLYSGTIAHLSSCWAPVVYCFIPLVFIVTVDHAAVACWLGLVVTAFATSMKLFYTEPGYYWDRWLFAGMASW